MRVSRSRDRRSESESVMNDLLRLSDQEFMRGSTARETSRSAAAIAHCIGLR